MFKIPVVEIEKLQTLVTITISHNQKTEKVKNTLLYWNPMLSVTADHSTKEYREY